ncbi:hypothetical protein BDE02_04G098600 [Populus trichocarpa]|nr:hypothetical protein BDE02_04G098600 [Populus trichocarpa]
MATHTENESCYSVENPSCLIVEMGELSLESPSFEMMNDEEAATNIVEAAATSSKKGIFERWANALVMVPFTILTNLFAAFCTVNSSNSFGLAPFSFHSLVFIVMLNFYTSIIGIVLWQVFPMVARGFHLMAFLCALLSLTILFGAVLPIQLNGAPWICMALVMLVVFVLLLHNLSPHP